MWQRATCLGSPNCPIKNVSAILYMIVMIWLMTVGTARTRIALGIGILQNSTSFFSFIVQAPHFALF